MDLNLSFDCGKDKIWSLDVHGFVISGVANLTLAGDMAHGALQADLSDGVWIRTGVADMGMFVKPGVSAVRWSAGDGSAFLRMRGFARERDAKRCAKAALAVAGADVEDVLNAAADAAAAAV